MCAKCDRIAKYASIMNQLEMQHARVNALPLGHRKVDHLELLERKMEAITEIVMDNPTFH